MNVPPSLQPVLRRWYIAAVGLLATILAAVTMTARLEPTYETTASVVLLPGKQTIPDGGNPFLYLGGLTQARDVLVQSMNADSGLAQESAEVPGGSVEAASDPTTSGPIVTLTVSASSVDDALRLLTLAEDSLANQLDTLQDNADTPDRARMTTLVLAHDGSPRANDQQAIRGLLVVVILGLGLTLTVTALVDLILRTSRRRREAGSDWTRRSASRAAGGSNEDADEGAAATRPPTPTTNDDGGPEGRLVGTTVEAGHPKR